MNVPNNLKYTSTDEWLRRSENGACFIGITDYAQHELTDIVYVDFSVIIGEEVKVGQSIAVIESVKAAADVYAPVSGKVVELNSDLESKPELLNEQPYDAWIVKIRLENPAEIDSLLTADAYKSKITS
ncbi:MAG: glycine cleavage system protein GcvH [Promethearchaeota archaeon]